MNRVYIILPVHNRREVTARFLDSLLAQSYSNYHLILVDDGSTDGTEAMARERLKALTVLRGKGDWWWAGGLQQGINWLRQQATAPDDVVLMINNDVTFQPDFLEKGVVALRERPHSLLLAECYSDQTGEFVGGGVEADLARLDFHPAPPGRINCLSTRGLFVRWEDVCHIGNFHPRFLPHYLSDYEWTIRAHKKGHLLYTTPELKLWLDEKTSGFREFENLDFVTFLRRYFSYRSVSNPWHWSAFTILASPRRYVPLNLLRIWKGAALTLLSHALKGGKHRRQRAS